jgi:hypothetical protein
MAWRDFGGRLRNGIRGRMQARNAEVFLGDGMGGMFQQATQQTTSTHAKV